VHGAREWSVPVRPVCTAWYEIRMDCTDFGMQIEARVPLGSRKCPTRIETWRQSFLGKMMPRTQW
jgi:hypothetical protein